MAFCIGLGEFNPNYFYLLLAVLSKLISQLALGLKYSVFQEIKTFDINLTPITFFTSSFLFSLIIGIIGLYISHDLECKIMNIQIMLGIIFAFTELYDQLFYSNNLEGLDYWMLEIIFLNIFISKFLNMRILSHQKYSLYLCVISSFILKSISNFVDSHSLENGTSVNVLLYVYIKLNEHWVFIPIIIFSYIVMLIIRAYGNTKLKYSMDILFLSPYRILLTYGLIGLIFCLVYIILSILINFSPLGTIDEYFESNNFVLVSSSAIIYGIFNSLKILFDLLIIRNLSPYHILVKYKIYYLLIQLILCCYNSEINYKTFYFIDLSSDIICFLGFLIYLELIEIRCLNHELRKNIIERAESEVIEALNNERICKFKNL